MIKVVRVENQTTQKVVSSFLKRAKKFNLVARKRKSKFMPEPESYYKRKMKTLKKLEYIAALDAKSKFKK
jgi:hypothetical protein